MSREFRDVKIRTMTLGMSSRSRLRRTWVCVAIGTTG
jgi:hypothetical protein